MGVRSQEEVQDREPIVALDGCKPHLVAMVRGYIHVVAEGGWPLL